MKVYNVWKTDSNGNPIDGSDRILTGSNLYSILKHLAYEEGVLIKETDLFVRCENGEIWHVEYSHVKEIIEGEFEEDELVECNMCGYIMWYNEDDRIIKCVNSECTRCY